MKKLGLVGGISWVSTIDYYRHINEGINERLGGLEFAECLVHSLNFGDVQRVGWDSAGPLLIRAAKTLEQSGADAIVLCANTAHRFADEIRSGIRIPLIHIVEATAASIRARQLRTVGLLGTKVTMESSFYVDGMSAAGIETLVPESVETRDFIQVTLKEELGRGISRNVRRRSIACEHVAQLFACRLLQFCELDQGPWTSWLATLHRDEDQRIQIRSLPRAERFPLASVSSASHELVTARRQVLCSCGKGDVLFANRSEPGGQRESRGMTMDLLLDIALVHICCGDGVRGRQSQHCRAPAREHGQLHS